MAQASRQKNIHQYKKGDYIFHEGDIGHELFIIKTGGVDVVKKVGEEEVLLARLGKNDFFGEMALFGNNKRSASIKANQESTLLVVTETVFKTQFKKVPQWFAGMFKVLIERIRKMDEKIVSKFKMGIEFSVLSIIFLLSEKYGKPINDKGKRMETSFVEDKLNIILGLPKSEIKKKLQDFQFIHILKFSEDKSEILIPDWERLEKFLQFIRVASEEGPDNIQEKLPEMGEEMVNYFSQLFKLISRKKDESIVVSH